MISNVKYLLAVMLLVLLTACATGNSHQGVGSNTRDAVRDRARAHTDLGAAYLQKNKLEIALDEFSQAAEIMPTYALAYTGLALVRSALGQDEEAEFNFKKSIDLDSSISETHNNYGTFLCSRGRYDESIEQFMVAVSNPLYATPNLAYANAGICAERKKDIKAAERYLNKALQLQPLTHSAAHRLAEIQFERGDIVAAKKTLQNAIVASPNSEILWLGVRIARALGDKNNESSYALELRRRFPNSEATQLLLNKK
ncbi:MAG: type IV pilus biogenesis/stability protein PilW [Methylophilaceae bacterium]